MKAHSSGEITLQNKKAKVRVAEDKNYSVCSYYDTVFDPCKLVEDNFFTALSVTVDNYERVFKICLVGSVETHLSNCCVLEENILTVLLDDLIVRIDVGSGSVISHFIIDSFGSNLGIYAVDSGYIIHGEVEIRKYSKKFDLEWKFSGKDVFVPPNKGRGLVIDGDRIKLRDFMGNYYELDMNGAER